MVEVNNLDELCGLIANQVTENFNLTYKSADALVKTDEKEKEVAKDISAFANSGGGIIIYGIKKYNESAKKYVPEIIDPINGLNFTKEWLENVIDSNVFPLIEDLYIKSIPLSSSDDDIVYVVVINKSNTVHQASDYRYYKRFNFESVPMCDFEIRDIMNTNKTQKIKLDFEIEQDVDEIKPMFPKLLLPNGKEERSAKKEETTNALYVYGRDIQEYMQIMLSVV